MTEVTVRAAVANWYVDATVGSDTFDGTSPTVGTFPEGPKKTITAMLGDAAVKKKGDIVNVAAGTYNESLDISKSLKVVGAGASTTIINGDYPVRISTHDVEFTGFTVTNPSFAGDASGIVIEPPSGAPWKVRVHHNIIHDIGDPNTACGLYGRVGINIGFRDGGSGPVEVNNNEIYNIKHTGSAGVVWANGICIWGNGPSMPANLVNVHDNYIHDISCPQPRAAGISLQRDVMATQLVNNRIENTKDLGIELRGDSHDSIQVLNNQINGSGTPGIAKGISCSDPYPANVRGNTITLCGTGVLVTAPDPDYFVTKPAVAPDVQLNRIFGNANYGLDNQLASTANAAKNWWGAMYGPTNPSNPHGTGDIVSNGATFNPWCTNSDLTEIVSFPSQVTPLMAFPGLFAIPVNATNASTPYLKAVDAVSINVTSGSVTHCIVLPTGTSITPTGGGNINTADLQTVYVDPGTLSGFADGAIARAALRFGITGKDLDFSDPVAIRLYVGSAFNGHGLFVRRSATGTAGWTAAGIVSVAPAVVAGYQDFTAVKASYYAALSDVTKNAYTVSVSVSGVHGKALPASQTVVEGNNATINITPDSGCHTASVTDNGSPVTPTPTTNYTINNVTETHDVVVTFAINIAQDQTASSTWYLAEGSTAWGFNAYITIENPNDTAVNADITYMMGWGAVPGPTLYMPPLSQATVSPKNTLGNQDFSTMVNCREKKTIAVDRTMTWTGTGAASEEAHNSVGVTSPATAWYLAEGSSAWDFECWLLIQNPNPSEATCNVTYMIEGEGPKTVTKQVPANSRKTFNMADDIGSKDASIKVESTVPVIPERAMYRHNRREGHDSIGTTSPATDYYLAEGTTAWGFTTYVLVQNPQKTTTDVTITYMTPSGAKTQETFQMRANSRKTVRLNDIKPANGYRIDVSNRDLSTKVHGSQPIIAESAMYWNNGTGEACHDSIGMDSPHTTFYLPDGQSSDGRETWTLVQNTNDTDVQVDISYLTPDGQGNVTKTETVGANSRRTFNMLSHSGIAGRAAIMVTCKTTGKKIMVERAMYWNNRGAGTDTIGGYSD